MDFKQICDKDLKALMSIIGFYRLAYITNGDSLDSISEKKAIKDKKMLLKHSADEIAELGEECRAYFDVSQEPKKLFWFFDGCEAENERRIEEKKQAHFAEFSDLDNDTAYALWSLSQFAVCDFAEKDGKYTASIESLQAYRLSLTVENFVKPPEYEPEQYFIEAESLTRDGSGRYCLHCSYENCEDCSNGEFDFYFENPKANVTLLNCSRDIESEPWISLATAANEIINKADYSLSLCNEAEIELMPLLKEVATLDCISSKPLKFPLIKELARAYGFEDIAEALGRIEGMKLEGFRDIMAAQKCLAKMSLAKYEPLWRDIYEKIAASQEGYSEQEALCEDIEQLKSARNTVEARMHENGYSGTYPDFCKIADMRGVHLAESYGIEYFVGMQKNVKHFVHCIEGCYDGGFYITFVSGTDLTKGGKCKDVYSCIFNDKGKRLSHVTSFSYTGDEYSDDLELSISIAVKRAECKPLSKAEKKQEYGNSFSIGSFIFWLIFAGGMFSLLFNAAFFPFMWLLSLPFGVNEGFFEFLAAMPWAECIAFTWVGFGLAFAIIKALVGRK